MRDLQMQFHELSIQREEILAKSSPLREQRDKFVRETREREESLNNAIREAEKDLFDIESSRARISRALRELYGGEVGHVGERDQILDRKAK
jgi:SMC interacting uncharacterized protein involved in chromosome segregation